MNLDAVGKEGPKKTWHCPCNGCKKARKQALQEVHDILYKDRDIAYNAYILVNELFKKEGIK